MLQDNDDRMVQLLQKIAANTGSLEESGGTQNDVTVNKTVNVSEPDDQNTPNLFSTGPDRYAVEDGDQFTRLDFGFVAQTINIRTTDDIEVAFTKPTNGQGQATIRGSQGESPFTIGGYAGIDTAFMWIRQADTASGTPGVEIIAFS